MKIVIIIWKLLSLAAAVCAGTAPSDVDRLEQQATNDVQQSLNGDQLQRPPGLDSLEWFRHAIALVSSGALHGGMNAPVTTSAGRRSPKHQRDPFSEQIVLRFNTSGPSQASSVACASNRLLLDIWSITSQHIDIRLKQQSLTPLLDLLPHDLRDAHTVLFANASLVDAIAATLPQSSNAFDALDSVTSLFDLGSSDAHASLELTESDAFFNEYRPLSVLYPWLTLLTQFFPETANLIPVGRTAAGGPIQALRITSPTSNTDPKPRRTYLITAGVHAREWISVSSAAYLAHFLLTAYGSDSDVTALLSSLDVLIVPTLNPDGYEYTFTHDRLWRKNRQTTTSPFCTGIDLDRNWDYAFAKGKSTNPCSENFSGETPFSAVESLTFSNWLREEIGASRMGIAGMVDLHSYSQQVLTPYAFSCGTVPRNEEDLQEVGAGMARAMKRSGGLFWEVLPACDGDVPLADTSPRPRSSTNAATGVRANSGGSPLDYFHSVLGVKYSYQIKLRDTGAYGFLLPPEEILPSGREVVSAVLFLGRKLVGDDDDMAKDGKSKTSSSEEL